ncbi:MAG: isocitrate dehydrogenase kinase/phosphatase AceK regulatory subunit [Bacteroidota bacterium]
METLKSIFYRNKGAYIVGRIHINGQHTPSTHFLRGEAG